MQARMKVFGISLAMLLVAAAGLAHAQRQRGFFGQGASVLRVATVPAVAAELDLTDEQTALAKQLVEEDRKQLDELFQLTGDLSRDEMAERFQEYNVRRQQKEKQLGESIGPETLNRIRQLSFQTDGIVSAFFNRETARQLAISVDQRREISQGLRGMRDEFSSARGDQEAMAKLRKKVNEKIAASLTDDQKTKWKDMLGKSAGDELLAKIRAAVSRFRR